MHAWRVISLMLVATTIACGGDSTSSNPPGGGESNPLPPGTVAVGIQDFSFSPASLTISAGTTVRWRNAGPTAHNTTSDTGVWGSVTLAPPSGGGGYGGGSPGGSFDFTFTEPGTYPYHCSLHPPSSFPGFTGTVTVTP